MAKACESSKDDLAERLLAALDAAEGEGGDIRGRQSAALLIVTAESTGRPWNDRIFDLRIEDHPDPLGELCRLVRLQRAYNRLNEGDEKFTSGNSEAAMRAYRDATELVPDRATDGEAAFWLGVALVESGRVDEALPNFVRAQKQDARWARLLPRFLGSELLPNDPELIRRLVEQMQRE